jgi:hypothetical protein
MPITGELYTFSDENLSNAPDVAGVYALYSGDGLIYIGRAQGGSTTIRSRLKDHKAGRDGRCTQSADSYKRETCSNPALRERELLQEYKNTYGKLPRCNEVMP